MCFLTKLPKPLVPLISFPGSFARTLRLEGLFRLWSKLRGVCVGVDRKVEGGWRIPEEKEVGFLTLNTPLLIR